MVKKSGSGRVKIGLKSPAVIIKPLRSFSSASGARTNPITKGPKGILAHSIRKPITPKISITQTSNMVLFKAKEPMTQKTMTIGRTKLLGKYINPAMYLTELVISNHINTFAKRQAAIIPQTISAFVRNRVGPEALFETEKRLLRKAKSLMPSLPFDQLDALIVEEFGKEISGAGLDPHISGRTDIRGVENPSTPFIHKIAALRMTAATNRNGMGTGMVDFLPQPTANKLDLHSMYMNAVSSTVLEKAFLPIVLANDQEVIRALVATCWKPEINLIRLAQIRSTLHLNEILLTTPLFQEAQSKGAIASFEDQTESFKFDSSGQLLTKVQC